MGSVVSLEWSTDVDSVAEPGKKCAKATFPNGIDLEILWNEVVLRQKEPMPGMMSFLVKSTELVEHDGDPDNFTLRILLDGAKLDSWGRGPKAAGEKEGTDLVAVYMSSKLDRKTNCMETRNYCLTPAWAGSARDNTDVEVLTTSHLLGEPLGIESRSVDYITNKEGEDVSKDNMVFAVKDVTEKSLGAIKKRRVAVVKEQGSLLAPGELSVMTVEAIDDVVYADPFFDALVKKTMEKTRGPPAQDVEMVADEDGRMEFTMKLPMGDVHGEPQAGRTTLTWDACVGDLDMVTKIAGSTVEWHYRIHHEPVRLESWQVVDGQRKANRSVQLMVQAVVDEIIESEKSWFGGLVG